MELSKDRNMEWLSRFKARELIREDVLKSMSEGVYYSFEKALRLIL